jgi:hypothetical protein
MDLMKSFGNLSGLVHLDPMDPSAPESIPFVDIMVAAGGIYLHV